MRSQKLFIFILLFLTCINSFAKETLIFAVDVVRHGDRSPQTAIPESPHKWPDGLLQLTPRGIQQEFQLGVSFRKKYIDKYKLLPKRYKNETLLAFSTDSDRTLMSAQALLMGLYPPGTGPILPNGKPSLPGAYQPIPIYIKSWTDKDKVIKKCYSEFDKLVLNDPGIKKRTAKLKNKLEKWRKATGLKLENITKLAPLADTLYIRQLHNVPIPSKLTKKDIKEIMKVGDKERILLFQSQNKELAKHCFGLPMLTIVTGFLEEAAKQKKPLKYVLFASHDSIIAAMLVLLENPVKELPRYASDLNFELFKTEAGNYLVKINYNGKPLTLPSCSNKTCTLKQFLKIIKANKIKNKKTQPA